MNAQKILLSTILILAYLIMPKELAMPLNGGGGLNVREHLLFMVSHVNVFHLAGNILCLSLLKIPLRLPLTIGISFVCSFVPVVTLWEVQAVCGFSGVIFAAIGLWYGTRCDGSRMIKQCLLPTVLIGLLPGMALAFHLYCLLAGFCIGYWTETIKLYGVWKEWL